MDQEGGRTVTDAELVRYLDGELDPAGDAALLERVRAEPASAARLETLRRRSERLSELLVALDVRGGAEGAPAMKRLRGTAPAERTGEVAGTVARAASAPRGRRHGPPTWLRIAAALGLVLGATFAAPQARAWIGAQARAVAVALGIAQPAEPAPGRGAAPAVDGTTIVRFAVTADTFFVDAPLGPGRLVVRRGPGTAGSARAAGPAGAELVVLPGGLRVGGTLAAASRIELVLPASVTAVRLRRGPSSAAVVHDLPSAGEELSLALDR